MIKRLFTIALLSVAALTGCANQPVSMQDTVQEAKGQVAGAYKSIGDLKAAGLITTEQGTGYFNDVETGEKVVRIAEGCTNTPPPATDAARVAACDPRTLKGSLQLAMQGLTALRAKLAAKGAKP